LIPALPPQPQRIGAATRRARPAGRLAVVFAFGSERSARSDLGKNLTDRDSLASFFGSQFVLGGAYAGSRTYDVGVEFKF
jgi:hypothetical protein